MSSDVDAKVEVLSRSVADLEGRVIALERLVRTGAMAPEAPARFDGAPEDLDRAASPPAGALVGFIGRTLIVLAGAFLLRAITDAGILARAPGTALGLAYAFALIVLADLAAGRGGRLSAGFHALAASLIAFPLLAEATTKYTLIAPGAAAGALVLVSGVCLAVAWRRRLPSAAWMAAGGGAITALGLAVATDAWIPFGYTLLVLSVLTLGLHYTRNWYLLAWAAGLALNLLVAVELVLALIPRFREAVPLDPGSLVVFLLVVVLVYVAVFGSRTLLRGQNVRAFEILQSTGVILVGLLGAVLVSRVAGRSTVPPALLSLALAAGSYGVAFTFVDRRVDRKTNFLYYTTLALPLALIAGSVLLDRTVLVFLCSGLAVAAAWLGGHFSRVTLNVHGAVYAVTAAFVSGLIAISARSFVDIPRLGAWGEIPLLVSLGALASCGWISAATHGRTWGRLSRAPKLVLLAALVWCASGLVVALVASLLPWTREPGVDAGVLATVRTGVLAIAALALGWMGRLDRLFEARLLVYPVLVVGGIKLVVDDFSHGRPTTLFLSLALLGTALIVAPRLARRAARVPA